MTAYNPDLEFLINQVLPMLDNAPLAIIPEYSTPNVDLHKAAWDLLQCFPAPKLQNFKEAVLVHAVKNYDVRFKVLNTLGVSRSTVYRCAQKHGIPYKWGLCPEK